MNKQVIDTYLLRHEHFLEKMLNELHIPAPAIYDAMFYALFPGGKRIRPILAYLVGDLLRVDLKIIDYIAAAVELTHCYSLIHDDLPAMDNDDFRRGKPSCHKAFDEATAILVGDGMQALAIELLLNHLSTLLSHSQVINITLKLVKASGVGGMVSGQSLDLSELANSSITEEQLRGIHQLKTGKLISSCIEMVISATNSVSEFHQSALRSYANHLGLVFQMQDDYLDQYAPESVLGKKRASDLANQKTTYATLLSQSKLEEEIQKHYQLAINSLQAFDTMPVRPLIELTMQLQNRSVLT